MEDGRLSFRTRTKSFATIFEHRQSGRSQCSASVVSQTVIPRSAITALLFMMLALSCGPQPKAVYQARSTKSTSKGGTTGNLKVTWMLPLLFAIPVLIKQINN